MKDDNEKRETLIHFAEMTFPTTTVRGVFAEYDVPLLEDGRDFEAIPDGPRLRLIIKGEIGGKERTVEVQVYHVLWDRDRTTGKGLCSTLEREGWDRQIKEAPDRDRFILDDNGFRPDSSINQAHDQVQGGTE